LAIVHLLAQGNAQQLIADAAIALPPRASISCGNNASIVADSGVVGRERETAELWSKLPGDQQT